MNNYVNIIRDFARQYKELMNNSQKAEKVRMPGNAYFLEDGSILALQRDDGDSRYQYGKNGFNLWVYSSGYIHANEGLFTQFLRAGDGQEPKIAFFAGIPDGSGCFEPVPLLPVPVYNGKINSIAERFTIFTRSCAYFITEFPDLRFAVRIFPDEMNYLHITLTVENLASQKQSLFISTYLNPFLVHNFSENVENKWFREVRYLENKKNGDIGCFTFKINEDLSRAVSISNYGVVHRSIEIFGESKLLKHEATTSRYQYVGGIRGSLHNASSLYKGSFGNGKDVTCFTETGIAGDMIHFEIAGSEAVRYDAELSYKANCMDQTWLEKLLSRSINITAVDTKAESLEEMEKNFAELLYCKVKGSYIEKIKDEVFNGFFEHLKKQVEFCSLIKGYVHGWAGSLIGVRDVFQALEGLIFWRPEAVRVKIIEALNFVFTDGRCPRQYSLPRNEDSSPAMDLRPFIDQGVWVISTIYSYLKVTGDIEILNKECGYYEIVDEKKGLVCRSKERDTVLEHMLRIMEYLLSKRDMQKTGCIRAIYGDWNDALDGLGVSSKPGVEYGSGVSVMASLQVYQNLAEMIDILERLQNNKYLHYTESYKKAREELKDSLNRYAIIRAGNGEMRILHGWGDEMSYLVGSFDDPDHKSRHGLTTNAFWVLSGMYDGSPKIRETMLNAFNTLDSKYGLKTFEPYFPSDTPGVGRICKLPPGTAENGASYIHATAFGAMALYRMGYPKEAWTQITKILPFTHDKLSHSPFVMPNSYVYNEDLKIDGESMADWVTGSSNVLLKTLIRYVFGFEPEFDGLWIQTAAWVPFEEFSFRAVIRGCKVNIYYKNTNVGNRKFKVNDIEYEGIMDEKIGAKKLWISSNELKCGSINVFVND